MASSSTITPPVRPPIVQPGSGNSIIINPCQRLNPMLECIRNVSKEFGDIVPDFQLGRTTCALYLSLKYHRLHPEYIHQRIKKLGNAYKLRVLLLMCDVSEHQDPIRELTRTCLVNNITIIVSWSIDEAGLYLSLFKSFEHKSPDLIKERLDKDYHSVLRAALTSVSKVNKVDVEMLRGSFGSFAGIAKATPEQLRLLPGLGPTKVRRITEAVEKPFRPGFGGRSSLARDPTVGTQARDVDVDFELEMDLNGDDIDEFPDTLLDVDDAARASASRPRRPELEPDWNVRFADLAETEVQVHGTDEPTSTAKRKRGSSPLPLSIRRPAPRLLDDGGNGAVVPLGASEGKRRARSRSRSRSPVWDIELDLNSD